MVLSCQQFHGDCLLVTCTVLASVFAAVVIRTIILWAEQNTRYQNRSTKFESGFLDATITMSSIILWAEQNTRYQNCSTKFESGFLDATITMFYNIVGRTEYKKISESFDQVRKSFSRRNDHNVRLTRMPSARVRFHEIIHRRLHDARYYTIINACSF
jgi:hypothetical protein